MAQSSTLLVIGPSLSILQLRAIAPYLLILPKLGRSPVVPHSDEGDTIDPRVSEPIAKGIHPAATADADPAEEPLDPRFRSQGFLVFPPNQTSPIANSPKVIFAISIAPAFSNLVITVASTSII